MASNSRKSRGNRTQLVVAQYYQANGWPEAESVASAYSGRDITRMLGLAPEVKARRQFDPQAWMRQAVKNAKGDLPFVVMRPDGMGELSVPDWPTFMRLEDHTALLRQAGYGAPDGE